MNDFNTAAIAAVAAATGTTVSIYAYPGDGAVLLVFDVTQDAAADLAGFAVSRKSPSGKERPLQNRLSFHTEITKETTPEERTWHSSFDAPFQLFRWTDFPGDIEPGEYTYTVTAMYFQPGTAVLKRGDQASVKVVLGVEPYKNLQFGFTRGYLSSQAYAERFGNKDIRPSGPKRIDFSTADYQAQYEWLGGSARKLMIHALEDCQDEEVHVDLFAYDLDEPDFILTMGKMGKRLRAYLDNAPLHSAPDCCELQARAFLIETAGAENVRFGHFGRFAHNKVLIFKRMIDGVMTPYRVLTGSANFSVRGLYVQSNNMLLFDNPDAAKLYADAFEQAFTLQDEDGKKNITRPFADTELAQNWHDVADADMPAVSLCFSPHDSADLSLNPVGDAIDGAKSSVLFAIMELGGSGPALAAVNGLPKHPKVFGYGVTQSSKGAAVYSAGSSSGKVVPFSYLHSKVPAPFQSETSGGAGQVIHDKFVVVDFNGDNPVVFTGSSNLAAGGEQANGDNLIKITDKRVVTAFAVEAIRMVDHYQFRAAMSKASEAKPLQLQGPTTKGAWWEGYFDPASLKCRERLALTGAA